MADQTRQLVVLVESTAAMGFHWRVLYKNYIEKIVRAFYDDDVHGEEMVVPQGETGLVLFNSHHGNQAGLVQQMGWTTDMGLFLQWLSKIDFTGGGSGDVAIAEGLADALRMCGPGPNAAENVSQGWKREKHVLLVATSNPCIIPKPVASPPETLRSVGGPPTNQEPKQWCLADCEDVARWFPPCSVSLSVICPRRLPQLISIYDLANRSARSVEPESGTQQHPYHTILVSDCFWEARVGLRSHESSEPQITAASGQSRDWLSSGRPGALSKPQVEVSEGQGDSGSPQELSPACNSCTASNTNYLQGQDEVAGPRRLQNFDSHLLQPGDKQTRQASLPCREAVQQYLQKRAIRRAPLQCFLQHTPAPGAVHAWEGLFTATMSGQFASVCSLQCFRQRGLPGALAADWPPALHVPYFIHRRVFEKPELQETPEILLFRPSCQHPLIQYMTSDSRMVAMIELPSEVLFLLGSQNENEMIGFLFPRSVFEPQRRHLPHTWV